MKLNFPWQKFQMIRACMDFAELRLWEEYVNMDFFIVRTPLEKPVIVSIMGDGGEEYGLSIFRGDDIFKQVSMILDDRKDTIDKIDTIGFSMMYYNDMSRLEKNWIKSCNYQVRRNEWLPSVILKRPGHEMGMVEKDHDVKLMLYIVKGIIKAHEAGEFEPDTYLEDPDELLTLDVSGDPLDPNIEVSYELYPQFGELAEKHGVFDISGHTVPERDLPAVDFNIIPADDDLDGWKNVQLFLTNRFIRFWNESDYLRSDDVSEAYFGDTDWDYYIDEYSNIMSIVGYVNWAALSYRAKNNEPTYAERLLEDKLPQAARISLESLMKSFPSLYQIKEIDKKTGNLVLRDLLLSKTVTVHDKSMSQTAKTEWFAPFRVYQAGGFNFVDIAGPVFSPLQVMAVMEELQRLGLPSDPSPQWLRENAGIFGKLWPLYDDFACNQPNMPELHNTDGDKLEYITAWFTCKDGKSANIAISQRDDIDYDKQDDVYVWFRENRRDEIMPTTLLGRLYFDDDKIKAEVNSPKRLKNLRKWLEKIDGVRYQKHESQSVEQMLKQSQKKKELAIDEPDEPDKPLSPEVVRAVERQMGEYYMNWLDKPNPALGNKTPRQAAKNRKDAQKIRVMIEAIPSPVGNANVDVPREKMLQELGLL